MLSKIRVSNWPTIINNIINKIHVHKIDTTKVVTKSKKHWYPKWYVIKKCFTLALIENSKEILFCLGKVYAAGLV